MSLKNLSLAALFVAAGFVLGAPNGTEPACICQSVRNTGGWCKACKVGYVAGVKIESALVFEALDAHGHDIDPDSIECPSCQRVLKTDGFCEHCRMGFVHGKAYMSRLTYHVAKGRIKDVDKIACPKCRKNAKSIGWCKACHVGMMGPVAIENEADFQRAKEAYTILRKAIEATKRCEICAAAIVTDGRCPKCNIRYKGGDPVAPDTP